MTRISKQEFARRRKNLMAQMEPDSIAIVPAAKEVIRNRDCEYHFRQDSDFYYLTGFAEPDAVLLLIPGREYGETIVFCRERDPKMELWHGYRAGPEGVCAEYGADDAFPISDIDDILPGLLEGRERVYYSMGRNQDFDRKVMGWVNIIRSKVRSGAPPPGEFLDLDHLLHDLRLYKSAAEIRIMRKAGELSAQAHKRAMQICKPGIMEYQLESEILHEFSRNGARFPAYSTIVGAGKNGCVLHLGLLKGELDTLIEAGAYKDFYMHRAGHWLGMDVHDVGDYKVADEWRVLEEGMAMTVEPGIYVAPDNMQVAKKWRGIGIRIEDDIVVTKDGCENLTAAVPKTVAEIEALMAEAG